MRGVSEYATYIADSLKCSRPSTTFCQTFGTQGLGIRYEGITYEIRLLAGSSQKYPSEFSAESREALDEAMIEYSAKIEALYIAFVGTCSDIDDSVLRYTFIEYDADKDEFYPKYTDPGFIKTVVNAANEEYDTIPADLESEECIAQMLATLKPLRYTIVKAA